jgi:hypothetical protein
VNALEWALAIRKTAMKDIEKRIQDNNKGEMTKHMTKDKRRQDGKSVVWVVFKFCTPSHVKVLWRAEYHVKPFQKLWGQWGTKSMLLPFSRALFYYAILTA